MIRTIWLLITHPPFSFMIWRPPALIRVKIALCSSLGNALTLNLTQLVIQLISLCVSMRILYQVPTLSSPPILPRTIRAWMDFRSQNFARSYKRKSSLRILLFVALILCVSMMNLSAICFGVIFMIHTLGNISMAAVSLIFWIPCVWCVHSGQRASIGQSQRTPKLARKNRLTVSNSSLL